MTVIMLFVPKILATLKSSDLISAISVASSSVALKPRFSLSKFAFYPTYQNWQVDNQ